MKALTIRGRVPIAALAFGMAHFFSARGQGLIVFFNNNLTGPNGPYRAGIYRDEEGTGAGAGYTAGLFLASDLMTPLATTTFRITSAYEVFATSQVVAVPGVPAGQTANLVVRAWLTSAGSFANSIESRGEQAFTSRPLGETVPVDMGPGFTGFSMGAPFVVPPLPLGNGSFETPAIPNGHVQFGTPASWTVYNPQNINGSTDAVGVLNAIGSQQYATGVPNGKNAGLVHLEGATTGEAGLQQSLPSYYAVSANTIYVLRVRVGNPAAGMSGIGQRNLEGFPGYRIDLVTSDGTILASDNNTLSIPEGEFNTATVEFVVGDVHPKMGQGLQVRLVNLNQRRSGEASGIEVNFDAVSFAIERISQRMKPVVALAGSNSMTIQWGGLAGDVALQKTSDLNGAQWQVVTEPQFIDGMRRSVSLPRPTVSTYFRVQPAP